MSEAFPAYIVWLLGSVLLVSGAALLVAGVSVISALRRRWTTTIRLGRGAFVVSVAVLVSSPLLVGFVYSRTLDASSADGSSKATVLAQAIAEVMNCTVAAPLAILVGGMGWTLGVVGKRRQNRSSS